MPATTVSAVPLALLDVPARTEAADDAVRLAGGGLDAALAAVGHGTGLGAAVIAHVGRARALADGAAATGMAILLAGGAAGALAIGLRGAVVDPGVAAVLLAAAFGVSSTPTLDVAQPDIDPLVVAALAAVLGTDVLAELAVSHPHLIGPVDGMPVDLRYAANRRIAERAGLHELASPERQLLLVDPGGGRVAEVLGDLRSASAVAVVVPGMGNDLAGFDVVLTKAEALRTAARALDPPGDLVTVAWLGYDSPQGPDVLLDDDAIHGGNELTRLLAGLTAGGTPAAATRTVVGHSYGSVVAGHALRSGAGAHVDAVAVTGSPGMDAGRASELGSTPIYAMATNDDLVPPFEHFGTDPTDPDFGSTVLATGGARGHAEYFEPCTEAIANLALVATGRGAEATRVAMSSVDRFVELAEDIHQAMPDPIDEAQLAARSVSSMLSDTTDAIGEALPDGAADVLDEVQHGVGNAYEIADRLVDDVQRVASPGFVLEMLFR